MTHKIYKGPLLIIFMNNVWSFETKMEKKYPPSMNFSWTIKKPTKRKLSPEFQDLFKKLWGKDGKEST